ncbi:MAG TPA: hypothetical protein VF265_08710 [Nevskiaceae bacterium]
MQVRIEIDVEPEELRRFLGLPDVSELQKDFVHALRDKVGTAAGDFDVGSFLRGNLDMLRSYYPTMQRLLQAAVGAGLHGGGHSTTQEGKSRPAAGTSRSARGKGGVAKD